MLQSPGVDAPQANAMSVFTQGFLNASMLQLAVCAPPRQAMTRRYSEIYITELGAAARRAAEKTPEAVGV